MLDARISAARLVATAIAAIFSMGGCSSSGVNPSPPTGQAPLLQDRTLTDFSPDVSVMKQLKKQVVIGSTVDPANGAQNPYGLTVAPITAGKLKAGDLVVCNFNAKSNVQGTGRSIVALHPLPHSTPMHVSSDKTLVGCDALALGSDDTIWAASMVANDNPVIDVTGKLILNISGKPFNQPWGQIFAQPKRPRRPSTKRTRAAEASSGSTWVRSSPTTSSRRVSRQSWKTGNRTGPLRACLR